MKYEELKTPCYIVDEELVEKNLLILKGVMERTQAKILLAQKAFSMYELYPLIGSYLAGATASGIYEARLGYEEMGKENHIFSPAYKEEDFDEIVEICDHIVFNSPNQVLKFGKKAKDAGRSIGIRINPECSTQEGHAIYDPCAPGSRLGTTYDNFVKAIEENKEILELLDGLHFHTLCEQDAEDLEITLTAFLDKFGTYLKGMKWLNFGGGHHITREGYQMSCLENCIKKVQEEYKVMVYIEPGEAIALKAGFLKTKVLEIMENGITIGILDTSAACHMPDVIEMPYRPPLTNSGEKDEKKYNYRLAGPTCLAGDIIGDYSFEQPLKEGDILTFEDMAIYSMVKNNTFNGMPLPSIVLKEKNGNYKVIKEFNYEDFKSRL